MWTLILCLLVTYQSGLLRAAPSGPQRPTRHYIASLHSKGWYQIRKDYAVLIDSVQASVAGSLAFGAHGSGYFEIIHWTLVPALPPGRRPPEIRLTVPPPDSPADSSTCSPGPLGPPF